MHLHRLMTIALAVALFGATGCSKTSAEAAKPTGETAPAFGSLTIDEVSAKLEAAKAGKLALFVYDNNSPSTYANGHLPTAKWLDHESIKASDLPADKEATLVFYCASET